MFFSFWFLLPHNFIHDFPNSIHLLMVLASAYREKPTSNSDARSGIQEWVSCQKPIQISPHMDSGVAQTIPVHWGSYPCL